MRIRWSIRWDTDLDRPADPDRPVWLVVLRLVVVLAVAVAVVALTIAGLLPRSQ